MKIQTNPFKKLMRINDTKNSVTALTLVTLTMLISSLATAQVTELSDEQDLINYHSVIPENFHGAGAIKEDLNLMVILDTSGSMGFYPNISEGPQGCTNPFFSPPYDCAGDDGSRSTAVRSGLRELIENEEFREGINMGLMSFRTSSRSNGRTTPFCSNGRRSCAQPFTFNNAVVRAHMFGLDQADHRQRLLTLLGQEDQLRRNHNNRRQWTGYRENGSLDSYGGTPLEGSILAGIRYFTNSETITDDSTTPIIDVYEERGYQTDPAEFPGISSTFNIYRPSADTVSAYRDGRTVPSVPAAFQINDTNRPTNSNSSCPARHAIILLTDGEPTVSSGEEHPNIETTDVDGNNIPGGFDCGYENDYEDEDTIEGRVRCTADAARISKALGIPVYVIAFATTDTVTNDRLDRIAIAGSNQNAFKSNSSEDIVNVFKNIKEQFNNDAASSSNVSIVSSENQGIGSTVQARYTPFIEDDRDDNGLINQLTEKVTWSGELVSYFIDEYGIFREDTLNPGQLDGDGSDEENDDRPFVFWFNEQSEVTEIVYLVRDGVSLPERRFVNTGDRFPIEKPAGYTIAVGSGPGNFDIVSLDTVKPIWSGDKWLADIPNDRLEKNRVYTSKASHVGANNSTNYRHILTWDDQTKYSPLLANTTTIPKMIKFEWFNDNTFATTQSAFNRINGLLLGHLKEDTFLDDSGNSLPDEDVSTILSTYTYNRDSSLARYIDATKQTISFTRGNVERDPENPTRNRLIGEDTEGTAYRLGDILGSSPAQFDNPLKSYPEEYSDPSYEQYIKKYGLDENGINQRRRVVYVGSNSGMLHAFNGGFWNKESRTFELSSPDGRETEHDLGAELWAYVPKNLLPHLSLLHNPGYDEGAHISMMDGEVQAFDVRIFKDDGEHPGGWGTIIVAGMHLGGTEKSVKSLKRSPSGGASSREFEYTTGVSSYVVMDVTNPERPPILLAEINDFNPEENSTVAETRLRYTTSQPTIKRENDGGDDRDSDNWYLVFGSGPTNKENYTSDQPANIFKYDLKSLSIVDTSSTEVENSFTGDLLAKRWPFIKGDDDNQIENPDLITQEVVYFGLTTDTGNPDNPGGGMYRYIDKGSNDTPQITPLIDTDTPIIYRPNFATFKTRGAPDLDGESVVTHRNMVTFGSGREVDFDDYVTKDENQFYGVLEDTEDYSTAEMFELIDTTDINFVQFGENEGELVDFPSSITDRDGDADTEINTIDLQIAIDENRGWYVNLPSFPGLTQPSQKSTAVPLIIEPIGGKKNIDSYISFHTAYTPPDVANAETIVVDGQCVSSSLGISSAYPIDLRTGIPPFAKDFKGVLPVPEDELAIKSVDIGFGNSNDPIVVDIKPRVEDGTEKVIKFPLSTRQVVEIQPSLPDITPPPITLPSSTYRKSWTEIPL